MILIGNGRVITRDENGRVIDNGGVLIENDKIVAIGESSTLKEKYPEAEFFDVKGNVIMPGLINAHSHIYSYFARGMNLGAPPHKGFMDILKNQWWRMDKALTLEDVRYSAYATLLESVRYGVTTLYDHHASPFAAKDSLFTIGEVAKEIGIRTSLSLETSDRDGKELFEEAAKENVDYIKVVNKTGGDMHRGMFGMHAPFTLSNESMEFAVKSMQGHEDAGYHIHIAEGIDDAQDSLDKYSKRTVERMNDFGILTEKTLAIHCIHIDQREMDILKDRKVSIVHNPESNMGNAVGVCPAIKMLAQGIPVGLGTDAYTQDMIESLKVANIIHKHHLSNPNVGFMEGVEMLFVNNAKFVKNHFGADVGMLKEGYKADIVISEYLPHTPLTSQNFNGHVMFGMAGKNITNTIINGKFIMKNREIIGIDEEKIYERSKELASVLWKKASF